MRFALVLEPCVHLSAKGGVRAAKNAPCIFLGATVIENERLFKVCGNRIFRNLVYDATLGD